MKDFVQKYQKRKILGNIYMVLGAFVMAFAINFLVLDTNNLSTNLKTSVLDSKKNIVENGDFYLFKDGEKIILKNSKNMSFVNNFSFTIVYDSENLQIDEVKSKYSEVDILGEKGTGFETFIVYVNDKNISLDEVLAEISFSKKDENKQTTVNLLNSNFTDSSKNTYSLTTSGINL